jgi:Fe2+ or Zn2+ uptake regulation protein
MGRPSRVRDAIAELIGASERHDWTIEAVVDELRARGVSADYSSAFRGLERLSEDGTIRRVELGDGKARFEAHGAHHEHVRCAACGAVAAVPGCVVADVVPDVERETGFAITGHRLLFSGVCGTCARDPGEPS